MRTSLVHASNQQADTIWSLTIYLGVDLGLFANHVDEGAERDGAAVGETVAKTLLLHEVGEDASIRCQAGNGDAGMLVDGKEFLLVRGQFLGVSLRAG